MTRTSRCWGVALFALVSSTVWQLAASTTVAARETEAISVAGQVELPVSPFFVERFTGGVLNVHLQDDDGQFSLDNGSIRRSGWEGPASANRHYISTVRSDYDSFNWSCEVTLTAPPSGADDILFIGVGEAVPDPGYFNEPRNSLYLRIHQGSYAFGTSWRVDLAAHGTDSGASTFTYFRSIGNLPSGGGSHTVRITKAGRTVTFELRDSSPAILVTVPDATSAAPFLNASHSRIFFGNASGDYSYSDLRILPDSVDQGN
jgi:hypothetical protein